MKTTRDAKVSAQIMAIRTASGHNDGTRCTTCCQPVAAPFRRTGPDGRIVHGCIDASHTAHLVRPSASAEWHDRPVAQEMRRRELADLLALG